MVERIRDLLTIRQLTPTQFADAIGIARPIVSHILSGRNKPSLEVVQRLLAAMPELSMAWLLNGSGPMLAAVSPASPSVPAPAPAPARPLLQEGPARKPAVMAPGMPLDAVGAARRSAPYPRTSPLNAPKRFAAALAAPNPAAGKPAAIPPMPPLPAPSGSLPDDFSEAPLAASLALPAPALAPVPQAAPAANAPDLGSFSHPEKSIRRIVIFYRDGSFADYQPE